ncbi:hypothetical protein BLA29_008607 [Euroglyphus maynei]|uniref:Uncharacterized protein n=1 Tax=Euroglyphus maynei TaxID=6958 RepID=A0A1Y3B0X9_EURMA|nr:hypothetical protein BLA29_008607 [Euroglyphus maynei]
MHPYFIRVPHVHLPQKRIKKGKKSILFLPIYGMSNRGFQVNKFLLVFLFVIEFAHCMFG